MVPIRTSVVFYSISAAFVPVSAADVLVKGAFAGRAPTLRACTYVHNLKDTQL